MEINYNNIANGLDDIAKYLNLDPSKTLFIHSTSFDETDPKNISRKALNKGRMLYAEPLSYASNLDNGAKAGFCHYSKEYLNYLEEIGLIKVANIIKVYEGENLEYPYNSVSVMLNKKVKEDEEFRKSLDGYTLVSNYLSDYDVETAKLINGKVLMDKEEQIKFNSKYYFRQIGKKHNFSIPPGYEYKGTKEFDLNLIKTNYPGASIWIKLESQSSGTGNLFFENIDNYNEEEILNQIKELSLKLYDIDYIENEMLFIAEVDVSYYGEIVENIGVNGVVAPNKVTIVGGTSQSTKNGKYLGSKVDETTYKYLDVASEIAKDAFVALSEDGYYGYMTIDVMVVKKADKIMAFNIDPNARFSAGTMLLKNIHTASEKNNKKAYGISYTNAIHGNKVNSFIDAVKENKYNKETGFGIFPALINDLIPIGENKYYLKTVVVSDSYENALEMFEKFKEEFRK